MSTFADRLKQCGVGPRGRISAAELARKCEVRPASVSDWLGDKTTVEGLKAVPLLRAAAILEVNPMWLLTGKGGREPTAPTVLSVQERAPEFGAKWPFERVPPEKYYALPEHIQIGIQMMIDGVLLGTTFPVPRNGTGTRG
jgi:hypothetical protein